jgi:prepilin-type N-terminal cleavage/methylation domain-containing protein
MATAACEVAGPRQKESTEGGFTLVESVIALVILGGGLLGLAHLFVLAVHQYSYGRQNTMAVTVASDKLEQLRGAYNGDLLSGVTSSDLTAGGHGPVTVTVSGTPGSSTGDFNYRVSWSVAVAGKEKTVSITVEPESTHKLENRPVYMSGHLAP